MDNKQQIARFKEQAERMAHDMETGLALTIRSQDVFLSVRKGTDEEGPGKYFGADYTLSQKKLREKKFSILRSMATTPKNWRDKEWIKAEILERCIPFMKNEELRTSPNIEQDLLKNLLTFKIYFDLVSQDCNVVSMRECNPICSEELINFIEICYYAQMTREYSLLYSECKEDERSIFIKSQNKKNTAKKQAVDAFKKIFPKYTEEVLSLPDKYKRKHLSYNQFLANIQFVCRAKKLDCQSKPTLKRWLSELYRITPENFGQNLDQLRTKLENL